MCNGNAKTEEETSGDEHLEVHGRTLEDDGKDHNDRANADTPSSAKTVSNVGSDRQSEQGTEKHDAGEETLNGSGGIVHI